MGKAAMVVAGALAGGVAAFNGLAGVLPEAWAEGGALMLTGLALVAASFTLEPKRRAPVEAGAPRPQAQEA